MRVRIFTNTVEAVLTNESANSFNLSMDYSSLFDLNSPIAEIGYNESISGWIAEFACVNPDNMNMYKYIVDKWIPTYGVQRRIPVKMQFIDFNVTIENLYLSFDKSSGYKLDKVKKIISMPIVSKVQNIADEASGLQIRKLYNNDEVAYNRRLDQDRSIVRYILQDVPDEKLAYELGFQGLVLFYIWKDLIVLGKKIFEDFIGGLANATNPLTFILNLVKGIAEAAVYALVVNEVIKQTKEWAEQLSNAIFQKPKAYYCLPIAKIFERCIKHILGDEYSFASSILESSAYRDAHILPATDLPGQLRSSPTNNPALNTSFHDFVTRMSYRFGGAKLVVNQLTKEVRFDKIGYYFSQSLPTVTLQNLYNSGDESYNNNELITSLTIEHPIDVKDSNSSTQITTADISITDKQGAKVPTYETDLNKSLQITLNEIPAQRKTKETAAEKAFNAIWDFANNIANAFSKYNVNFNERIGYMVLQENSLNNDRIFLLESEKIQPGSYDLFSSDSVYNEWIPSLAGDYQFEEVFNRDAEQFCDDATLNRLFKMPFFINGETNELCCFTNISYSEETGLYSLEYRKKKNYIAKNYLTYTVATEKLAENEKVS